MDFPFNPLKIEGEYWIIYKNGYNGPVLRYKGTNIENAVKQKDGTVNFPAFLRAPYLLGGMWYDTIEKKLYAPMHCEVEKYNGLVMREIHLASSTDKGLSWKYEGLLLSRDEPGKSRRQPTEFSGLTWNGGDGDIHFMLMYMEVTSTCSPTIILSRKLGQRELGSCVIVWPGVLSLTRCLRENGECFIMETGISLP